MHQIFQSCRVGCFLALRSVKRGNRYVTILIIVIMTLIFLNLVAVGGLLLGLIQGANIAYIRDFSGSLLVEPRTDKNFIEKSIDLIDFIKSLPGFMAYSPRISTGVKLETDYKNRPAGMKGQSIGATIVGIDPVLDAMTTAFSQRVIEGRFLRPDDRDKIVLGSVLAARGATISIGESLKEVNVGDKVLATFGNGVRREYEVVGIVKSKVNLLNLKAFMNLREARDVLNIRDNRLTQIAIKTNDPFNAPAFKKYFTDAGYDKDYVIKTWDESLGSFVNDINSSFNLIADIVGGIGLVVGGITIFILIFVNAVSKRRYIGVLKACGITPAAIVLSYVLQGLFYTMIAVLLGSMIIYGFLIPYYDKHPVIFPFAEGIIYVTTPYITVRIIIIMFVAILSGFVPAYMIAKENTLNAILGR